MPLGGDGELGDFETKVHERVITFIDDAAKRKESDPIDPKQKFISDLDHLEKVMTEKMDDIRRQINELK